MYGKVYRIEGDDRAGDSGKLWVKLLRLCVCVCVCVCVRVRVHVSLSSGSTLLLTIAQDKINDDVLNI